MIFAAIGSDCLTDHVTGLAISENGPAAGSFRGLAQPRGRQVVCAPIHEAAGRVGTELPRCGTVGTIRPE
jgi:hypothetical protein